MILQSNVRLKPREIAAAVGLDPQSQPFRRAIRRLVDAGQIEPTGQTNARRYGKVEREFHSEARTKTEATAKRNAERLDNAVARVGLRERVMKAIAADPDCLTEDRLAAALNAHRDDVAEQCGWLLERGRVFLNADGTYRRNGQREMAA